MNKKIVVYQGKETNYEVSDDGRVFNRKTGRELKGTYKTNEYHMVQLSIDGKPKGFLVHRLVAEAFCEKPDGCDIVDHIDRDKYNNHYTNLRWVNIFQNALNVAPKETKSNGEYLKEIPEIGEEWQPVKGAEGYYISRDGRLLNIDTHTLRKNSDRHGYKRYSIRGKMFSAHLLVWEAFVGPVEPGMYIDHIDGDKGNNDLSNLRMVSQSENMKNAYRNGHKQQVGVSKYSKDGEFIAHYNSLREAAEGLTVSSTAIRTASTRWGSSAGFYWIRDDQDMTIEDVLEKNSCSNNTKRVPLIQIDSEGNEMARFPSFTAAEKALDISMATLFDIFYNKKEFQGYRIISAQDK